ncbi:hypothetical protein [Labrenzia sp. PHM005]|uniref:hypothetical protein n=1 Tax=Labrenzia sp. PHM005 TaxID=2590016 RepID=UPI0011401926|nr:hypothetical protein [Labrenzia sp. PHM005]QDG74432.1 hypothetical protein FJ695_00275 [Labrenzia sp. PHM005]
MLSKDLECFWAALEMRKNDRGEIILDQRLAVVAELALQDCVHQARQMEAARISRPATIIDLSDDKIVLFPIAKRSVPFNDGGAA